MSLARTALLAFIAMFFSDLFYTVMVVFESHYNAPIAATFDQLGWIATTICSTLAITEFGQHGWFTHKAKVLFVAISFGNILGTVAGVYLSKVI